MADDDSTGTDIKDLTQPGERLDPQRLKAEEGSWESVARRLSNKVNSLEGDLKKERDRRREAEDAAPGEDEILLTGEDANTYEAWTGLGESPEAVREQIEAGENAQGRVSELERNQSLRDFASATGASYDALAAHTSGETFETRTEEDGDGNEVQRGYVTPPATEDDPDPDPVSLADYDGFEHVRLFAETGDEGEAAAKPSRPSVPAQRPSGNAPSGKATKEDLKEQKRKSGAYAL